MSYDFNKREDFDYSHSYDYFGGVGLGKAELDAEKARKSKLGTYDLTPVSPPSNDNERAEIVRVASLVHKSAQRESLLKRIAEVKDSRMEFVWNKQHSGHPYFAWALHCIDREVSNWESILPGSSSSRAPVSSVPKPASSAIVKKGDRVEVSDLKSRPELNGKVGTVVGEGNGRWQVEFLDIAQTVSLAKDRCSRTSKCEPPAAGDKLPAGLRVAVTKLQSEQGRAMNGMEAFVTTFSRETDRYTVRLELSGELKSLKRENLHVVLPDGIEERVDAASGNPFYVTLATGAVSWKHPILGDRKRPKSEFVGRHSSDDEDAGEPAPQADEFSREEFLEAERKRLRLDKKRSGSSDDKFVEALSALREGLGVPLACGEPLFSGSAADLLRIIAGAESGERNKWMYVAVEVLLSDFRQLKFNKKQLTGLLERIDQMVEDGSVSAEMEDWLVGGLKIAMPITHSVL